MSKIVAATDFSARSQRALRRAGRFARQISAELILLHVVDDDQPEKLIDLESREADEFMNAQIASLAELRGVRCRAVVATGEAFNGILQTAIDTSADLIVMGAHRKQILRDVFIGTTIERVIRTGPFPVLMVNTESKHPYRSMIAPVDMSELSVRALQIATALGLTENAAVTVLHAFEATSRSMFVTGVSSDLIKSNIAEERQQVIEQLLAYMVTYEVYRPAWSYKTEEGGPIEVIFRVVKESEPDLLVIGTHGHSGISNVFLGSVAEEVLRSLDVDILAVPPPR